MKISKLIGTITFAFSSIAFAFCQEEFTFKLYMESLANGKMDTLELGASPNGCMGCDYDSSLCSPVFYPFDDTIAHIGAFAVTGEPRYFDYENNGNNFDTNYDPPLECPIFLKKRIVPLDYDMVVVDELSSFKNWQAKRFKALMKVRPKVKRIVGLTGTPSSNGLMDLFAEYKLLDMGQRLGRFIGQYRSRYFMPDKTNGHVVYSYKLLPGAEEAIYDRISDITISMKSADHLKMPELVNSRYMVHLDEPELEKYERMKRDLLLQLQEGEVTAANAAALSGKLSQMANGAVYSDDGTYETIHDRKLDALEDIIEAANGKPVLAAYWYQHDLERIQERLSGLKIGFARLDQERNIRRWNEGEVPVGLIHPASAGHGLNLQSGGNILVWFGLTWSLELYQQTVARLWRQGQKETVSVIHILAAKTIDEQIMRALETKDHTQKALIDAVKAEVMGHGDRQ